MSHHSRDDQNGTDEIDYPYTCDTCDRGFLTASAHNSHQRVHTDDIIEAPDGGEIVTDGGLNWANLSGFERDVLVGAHIAITETGETPNGQRILEATESLGYDVVQSGRFYPTLDELVRLDLLDKKPDNADARANRYALTDAGETLLANRRSLLERIATTDAEADGDGQLVADGGERIKPSDFTRFQIDILAVLAEEANYGLAIKRELEDRYDKEVNHGRLYPNLNDLVDVGLVEKGTIDQRTNEYSLTDEGRAVIGDLVGWYVDRTSFARAGELAPAAATDGGEEVDHV